MRLAHLATTVVVALALLLAPVMASVGCPAGAVAQSVLAGMEHAAHGRSDAPTGHQHATPHATSSDAGDPSDHPPAAKAGLGHGQCCCPCLGARATDPVRADIPLAGGPPAAEPVLAGIPAAPPEPPPRA